MWDRLLYSFTLVVLLVWKFALSKKDFLSYFLTRSNLWESPRQSRGFTSMNYVTDPARSLSTPPSARSNDLILGALGRAQAKYGVYLHAFIILSNHFHMIMSVCSVKQMSRFVGFFKGNVAKELGHFTTRERTFGGDAIIPHRSAIMRKNRLRDSCTSSRTAAKKDSSPRRLIGRVSAPLGPSTAGKRRRRAPGMTAPRSTGHSIAGSTSFFLPPKPSI